MKTLAKTPAIIEAAAMTINIDKQSIESSLDEYPDTSSLNLNSLLMYLPDYLLTLLKCIYVGQTIDCDVYRSCHNP